MKTTEQVKDGINKLKKAVERFQRDFKDRMPEDIGMICLLAILKDKKLFIESVKYHTMELGLNVESIEKSIIYKNLSKKYTEKDKQERIEQKKFIKKQVKDIKDGRKRGTKKGLDTRNDPKGGNT
jgi:hypothetical protein